MENKMPALYRKQLGSALLTALFIMTLVAIAATAMSTRLRLDIYRTRMTITSDKLYLASQGVTFWAMSVLSQKKFQHPLPSQIDFPAQLNRLYPGVLTKGELIDLQAKFNINNLKDKQYLSAFNILLEQTLPTSDASQQKDIVLAVENWVTDYQPGRGQDKLLNFYLQNTPPSQPSHQLMTSISELRLVRGITAQYYQALEPYITTLPETTPININTASKPVLMTLGNGLKEGQVDDLLTAIGPGGVSQLNDLITVLQKLNIPMQQITIESQYYLSKAVVTADKLTLINYTLLKRSKDKKGNVTVSIEVESLNTL